MKTFNIFIISLGIAGALSMSSCSNFLKEDPYSYVGIDDVGNDDDAVNLWVTGVYSKWLDDMARWGNFPRLLDMDCDYVSGPDWAFSNLGAGNFQGDEVPNTLWNGCYNLVNRANVAIERINKINFIDISYAVLVKAIVNHRFTNSTQSWVETDFRTSNYRPRLLQQSL